MKVLLYLIPICSLCLIATGMVSSNAEFAKLYALKGICNLNGEWMLSIKDVEHGHHQWMHVGQSHGSLQLISYDPDSASAKLAFRNQNFKLELAQNSHRPLNIIGSSVYSGEELDLINKKVAEYRQGIMQLLETPRAGTREREVRKRLEQDLEANVAEYKQRLLEQYQKTFNDPAPPATDVELSSTASELPNTGGPRITGGRLENRVNSRIWASDHIKKWGVPQE